MAAFIKRSSTSLLLGMAEIWTLLTSQSNCFIASSSFSATNLAAPFPVVIPHSSPFQRFKNWLAWLLVLCEKPAAQMTARLRSLD
jgi:hypothetical protein